jgi:hypothetical protein
VGAIDIITRIQTLFFIVIQRANIIVGIIFSSSNSGIINITTTLDSNNIATIYITQC